jgi:cyclomaltodextrinase / maltogenic alpha-amylase / neopullulanase
MLKPGRYRHFKGNEYQVLEVAKHSETLEEFVVYRALYGCKDGGKDGGEGGLWIRPLRMFIEEVERDGRKQPRFALIAEDPLLR